MTEGSPRPAPLLALVLLVLGAACGQALEVTDGRIRLVLHERIGRFSLYLLPESRSGAGLPLLVNQDPRTSSIDIMMDGRMYRLGESGEFKETVQKTRQGGRFQWDSHRLRVILDFALVSSRPREPLDAVQLTLTLHNLSASTLEVGVRFLLDTHLGEDGGPHFYADGSRRIEKETTFTPAEPLRFWSSLSPRKPGEIGLQCVTMGGPVTTPDRIVMANWKRLDKTFWEYDTSGSKNFNHLPYSINDSAVAHYYDPQPLLGGAERRITLLMGAYSPAGYHLASGSGAPETPQPLARPASARPDPVPPPPEAHPDTRKALWASIDELNALMAEIDRRLSSAAGLTEEEIRALENRLLELRARTPLTPAPPGP